jgi:hypothetical protein
MDHDQFFNDAIPCFDDTELEHRREYTAHGSAINIALRSATKQAQNGNQSTDVRRCRTMVGASHIGQLSLNGFNRPIDAYEAECWKLARAPMVNRGVVVSSAQGC